ncbi:uncharacterized protein BDZ99DRAFT_524850 [Mytilinidion resinicola]|uniref:Homeobox domain-containing protein n=1 Tax=Mytilinidion resinicola TaxID=574789 RepID=A0A6A6Y9A5_9PEZI|nr:uncharacterized protein BDZ99DRAFT_524850 [Mytilinidion resinicola]KAF2805133.1 hypothetical protein BDZ99DRAFT_524850 [Mytilinidion resinicola]
MFGLKPSKAAPSIWSFDSGYISSEPVLDESLAVEVDQDQTAAVEHSTTNFPFIEDSNGDFKSPNFWNVHVGGEHVRLQRDQQVAPLVTKVNVFTSKDCSRTNSIFLNHGQSLDESRTCVACELWAIANPGEGILCEKCSPPVPTCEDARTELAIPTSTKFHDYTSSSLESQSPNQKPSTPFAEICQSTGANRLLTSLPTPDQSLGRVQKDQRCSACELSALMSPKQPTKCASCIEMEVNSRPRESKPCKVTRSRARRGFKLPLSALTKLQGWLDANQHDPYPSAETKKQLAQQCGITEKQVTTWFTNARARQLNPMETWLSSNSEDDASSESEGYESYTQGRRFTTLANNRSGGNHSRPAQPSKIDTSHPRAESVSESSAFSPHSSTRGPSRRGKKKNYRKQNTTTNIPENTASTPSQAPRHPPSVENWQCTFCQKTLTPKSWRRHEETQHLPRSRWTCMLHGPRLSFSRGSTSSCCAFCMQKDPTEEHVHSSHRIGVCAARSLQDRTYYRPDHLRQHVKNFHNSTLFDITAAKWKSSAEESQNDGWDCGFCHLHLSDWNSREVHIAGHFRDGKTMKDWNSTATVDHTESLPTLQAVEPRRPSVPTPMEEHFSGVTISSPANIPFTPAMPAMSTIPNETLDGFLFRTSGSRLDNNAADIPMDGFPGTFGDLSQWPELSNAVLPPVPDDSMMYDYNDFVTEDPPWNGM